MGIMGGQGASMIFLSAWSAMLKYHSIVNTNIITASLFAYFLGADSFHLSLKEGLFPNWHIRSFILLLAAVGAVLYVATAFILTGKNKQPDEDKAFMKGLILKKGISMYGAVVLLYTAVCFLLLMSFQLGTKWGSAILLGVIALNLLVPVLIIMSMSSKDVSVLGGIKPDDHDLFLKGKGTNTSLGEAFFQPQFWFLIFSVIISTGVSRMMDENADLISLKNADNSARTRRTFQTIEVVGAVFTGLFLNFFRTSISPYAFMTFNSFLLVVSQVLMYFVNRNFLLGVMIATGTVGFVSGSTFTLMGVIAHEEYGLANINRILAVLLSFAAAGILLFQEFVFDFIYESYRDQADLWAQRDYGKWNTHIFLTTLIAAGVSFGFSLGAYLRTKDSDGNSDKLAGAAGKVGDFVGL